MKNWFLALLIVLMGFNYDARANADRIDSTELMINRVAPFYSGSVVTREVLGKHLIPQASSVHIVRGGVEGYRLALRSNKDVENLNVDIDPFIAVGGDLADISTDVRIVKWWYQSETAPAGRFQRTKSPKLVGELLLKDHALVMVDEVGKVNYLRDGPTSSKSYINVSAPNSNVNTIRRAVDSYEIHDSAKFTPFTLSAAVTEHLWIDLRAGQNVKAGKYSSRIRFSGDSLTDIVLPISVEVLDFDLAPNRFVTAIYYRGILSNQKKGISSDVKTSGQLRAELRNILDHGIEYPTIYQNERDPRLLNEQLAIRVHEGFPKDKLFSLGVQTKPAPTNKREISTLTSRAREYYEIARQFDIETLYLYGIDEAKGKNVTAQLAGWSALRTLGIKIFVAGYEGTTELSRGQLDVLSIGGASNTAEIARASSEGVMLLSYNNPQSTAEDPVLHRRNFGLGIWQSGLDGSMNYAYQDAFGSIWNDFDHHRFRDHCYTYPTTTGVIDTLAWEGVRAGVTDLRYLSTLLYELEAAELSSVKKAMFQRAIEALKRDGLRDMDATRAKITQLIFSVRRESNS